MAALSGTGALRPATASRVSGRPPRPETRPRTRPTPSRNTLVQVRTVIIDSQNLYAELLARAINAEPDLRCDGHAATLQQARSLITRQRPDVVILEIEFAGCDIEVGLQLAEETASRSWRPRVIILTQHQNPLFIRRAAAIGTSAHLSKRGHTSAVIESIRGDGARTITIDPRFLHEEATAPCYHSQPRLTPRENDALAALARVGNTHQAAKTLNIAPSTMASHLKSLRSKLHCHSNLELVTTATRTGLTRRDDNPRP